MAGHLAGGPPRARFQAGGFSLLEMMAAIAIVLILAAIAIPQIIGMREKGKVAKCDDLYHALDGEIANALDGLGMTSTEVIDLVLELDNGFAKNPRNRIEPVFVQDVSAATPNYLPGGVADLHTCQILLTAPGPLQVKLQQAPTEAEEGAERSFRIGFS